VLITEYTLIFFQTPLTALAVMCWNTLMAVLTVHVHDITLSYIYFAKTIINKYVSITKHIVHLHKTVIINIKFIGYLRLHLKGVLLERNKNITNILTHYAINALQTWQQYETSMQLLVIWCLKFKYDATCLNIFKLLWSMKRIAK